jgi:hypothetical protein
MIISRKKSMVGRTIYHPIQDGGIVKELCSGTVKIWLSRHEYQEAKASETFYCRVIFLLQFLRFD